jgi:hypothetical protein
MVNASMQTVEVLYLYSLNVRLFEFESSYRLVILEYVLVC